MPFLSHRLRVCIKMTAANASNLSFGRAKQLLSFEPHDTNSSILIVITSMPRCFVLIFVLEFLHIYGLEIRPRILQGTVSDPVDFPFFVNVGHRSAVCGGSLLTEK